MRCFCLVVLSLLSHQRLLDPVEGSGRLGVSVPLVVLGVEEDGGLLHGPEAVGVAWSLALQADQATWFPRYRPFPMAGLSLDHFQLVPAFQQAMRDVEQVCVGGDYLRVCVGG